MVQITEKKTVKLEQSINDACLKGQQLSKELAEVTTIDWKRAKDEKIALIKKLNEAKLRLQNLLNNPEHNPIFAENVKKEITKYEEELKTMVQKETKKFNCRDQSQQNIQESERRMCT